MYHPLSSDEYIINIIRCLFWIVALLMFIACYFILLLIKATLDNKD